MGAIRLQTLATQLTAKKLHVQLRLDRQEGSGSYFAQNFMKLYKKTETHTSRGLSITLEEFRSQGSQLKTRRPNQQGECRELRPNRRSRNHQNTDNQKLREAGQVLIYDAICRWRLRRSQGWREPPSADLSSYKGEVNMTKRSRQTTKQQKGVRNRSSMARLQM